MPANSKLFNEQDVADRLHICLGSAGNGERRSPLVHRFRPFGAGIF
jgi:hypothetical protein